jgi:hypothetical protein
MVLHVYGLESPSLVCGLKNYCFKELYYTVYRVLEASDRYPL